MGASPAPTPDEELVRSRSARNVRLAVMLGAIAALLYVAFILKMA